MTKQIVRIVIWGSVAIAVAIVSYRYYSTRKVNGLIHEANALIDEGIAKDEELGPEAKQFLSGAASRAFVGGAERKTTGKTSSVKGAVPKTELALDRAKSEPWIAKSDGVLAKEVESYRAAAAKFEEARNVRQSELVSRYLDLMSQAYQNRADSAETCRKAIALLADKSIQSADELRKRREALIEDANRSERKFRRFEEEAVALHKDNESKFK